MCAVITIGAGTMLIAALLFAPVIFHDHLQRARLPVVTPDVQVHVEEAFDASLLIALGVGVLSAISAAAAVTWLVARRLAVHIQDIAVAAQRLADGHYDAVVADPHLGPEFETLATSITRLSQRLAQSDTTRHRLTSDLAHQLRTPLASLEATVEAVADGVLPADGETLDVLTDQTRRLRHLVSDLEKVSRAEERHITLEAHAQQLEPLLTRWVAGFRERYHAARITLFLDVDDAVPQVRIDEDRLAEAVGNLLENALAHTPPGGQVTLHLSPRPPLGAHDPGGISLTITDTGDGFPTETSGMIFERFYRGGRPGASEGSGLGLTIARALVEAHGGRLTGSSEGPGRGAIFTIILPTAQRTQDHYKR